MDPFLETNPIFQELHTQMLAEMQRCCNRSYGRNTSLAWNAIFPKEAYRYGRSRTISLERKEPDITVISRASGRKHSVRPWPSHALRDAPEELDADELELRKPNAASSSMCRIARVWQSPASSC